MIRHQTDALQERLMRLRPRLCLPALLLLAGCGGGGMAVRVDVDPLLQPRATAWKTWAWLPVPGGTDTRPAAALGGSVIPAVERALAARGYQQAEGPADLLVGWHAAAGGPLDVNDVSGFYGYSYGRWYPGGGVRYSPRFLLEYPEGTLLLDLVDGRSRELVWRGRITVDLKKLADPAQREGVLDQAVRAIVAQFRPQPAP
jgi:hypothetical protein